jgi:ABC-type multidrug transport system ATPase subunit
MRDKKILLKIPSKRPIILLILLLIIPLKLLALSNSNDPDSTVPNNDKSNVAPISILLEQDRHSILNHEHSIYEQLKLVSSEYLKSATDFVTVEHLIAPATGAASGMYRCKDYDAKIQLVCAGMGFAFGLIDEIINYSKAINGYDKNYLTFAVVAVAGSEMEHRPFIATQNTNVDFPNFHDASAIIGTLIPIAFSNVNIAKAAAPLISASAGYNAFYPDKTLEKYSEFPMAYSATGTLRGLAAGMGGVADELMIYNKITDKHYVTDIIIGIALARSVTPSAVTSAIANIDTIFGGITCVGVPIGLIIAYHENGLTDEVAKPLKTAGETYKALSTVIPKNELDKNIERQALLHIGQIFFSSALQTKIVAENRIIKNFFTKFENPSSALIKEYTGKMLHFGVMLAPYVFGRTMAYLVKDHLHNKLYYAFYQKNIDDLFSDDAAIRVAYDKNATFALEKLPHDIFTTIYDGSGVVTSALEKALNGIHGTKIIMSSSPSFFVYNLGYEKITSTINNYIFLKRSACDKTSDKLQSDLSSITKNDFPNIKIIAEKDGLNATKSSFQKIFKGLQQSGDDSRFWDTIDSIWGTFIGSCGFIIKEGFLVYEIYAGRIPFDQAAVIQDATYKVTGVISWLGEARNTEGINMALARINQLENKIYNPPEQATSAERIPSQTNNTLISENLEVGFEKPLISIKDFNLEKGKIYALTGRSGKGKTRLLYKLKGIKADGSYSKGVIQLPSHDGTEPKIVMVSQQDYFPIDATLNEVLSYPDQASNSPEDEAKIKELLHNVFDGESRVSSLDLTSKEDWYSFSGGEKKRLALISAILKKPDILILDESFAGLDTESILIIQKMLKELRDTIIIVVDHHARCNNCDSFYDRELHVVNHTIITRDMPNRNDCQEMID